MSFAISLLRAVDSVMGRTLDRSVMSPFGSRINSLFSSDCGMLSGFVSVSFMISRSKLCALYGSSLNSAIFKPGDEAPLLDLFNIVCSSVMDAGSIRVEKSSLDVWSVCG